MPLSDELRYALELARKNLNEIYAWDEVDVIDLLRIIDTLQAENAALREVLAALVTNDYQEVGWFCPAGSFIEVDAYTCGYCGAPAEINGRTTGQAFCLHDPGCPVARARELLQKAGDDDNK